MTVLFEGETEISGRESFRFSGGLSLFRRGVWILSISFLGWVLFSPVLPAVVMVMKTATALLMKPDLWLNPLKIWPGVPPFPAIALVLFAFATALTMVSIAVVCIIRPIVNIALLQRRHETIANVVGLAGRAYYIISDDGFYVRNCSNVGERIIRFDWAAVDHANEHDGTIRLSYKNKTVAQIPLRAFAGQENDLRAFFKSATAPMSKHEKVPSAATKDPIA